MTPEEARDYVDSRKKEIQAEGKAFTLDDVNQILNELREQSFACTVFNWPVKFVGFGDGIPTYKVG